MKNILAICSLMMSVMLLIAGCKKVDDLPYYNDGNAITLTASRNAVTPALADSNSKLLALSWTSPNYSADPATYKFVIEIDSAGRNFSKAVRREVIGKQADSLTGRDLNSILLNNGFTIGTAYNLDVRVFASYNNNNERYTSNTVQVAVTPFVDPSVFSSTATTVTGTLATAGNNAATFSWTPSFRGYPGAVTYTIQYDSSGKNFASLHEIAGGAGISNKTLLQSDFNNAAITEGVTAGTQGKIEFRIKGTTAQGAVAYSNAIAITINTYVNIIRLYLPGSYQGATGNGNDWDPPTAPEFIRDTRTEALNKLYYMYIYLPANTKFKITPARSWNTAYGDAGSGNISGSGGDISVNTAGMYRISVDLANMKYDIREGRMGFVGGATGAGWTPSNVFPAHAMGLAEKNLFVGVDNFTVDGWKMIDYNDWNSGDINATNARSYGSNGPSGSQLVVNGPNMPNPPAVGRYRVMWDGRDPNNVKYEMYAATEMRVVGDGINMTGVNDWDPPTSPQMIYAGNGVWTATITLRANKDFKFVAGNAWGAFDYEDNSGQTQATGIARKIKWEGGNNFKTPTAAGTYTITLNEKTQTVTIN